VAPGDASQRYLAAHTGRNENITPDKAEDSIKAEQERINYYAKRLSLKINLNFSGSLFHTEKPWSIIRFFY